MKLESLMCSYQRTLTNFINGLSGDTDIDAFVLFSYENNAGGTVGIAWGSTTCDSSKGYRASINEYFQTQTITAVVRLNSFSAKGSKEF